MKKLKDYRLKIGDVIMSPNGEVMKIQDIQITAIGFNNTQTSAGLSYANTFDGYVRMREG